MTIGTGRSFGSAGIISIRALGPPVEIPIATTSMRLLGCWAATTGLGMAGAAVVGLAGAAAAAGGTTTGVRWKKPLIFGTNSSRRHFCAATTLPTFAGLVT